MAPGFKTTVVLYVAVAAFFSVGIQGRAVNISNTWVLPEEGFPVFYRYFRDRISWYEADAVCQFHHGNLVTVDTTSQFDAVRAYLKELDIISNVWIGLTRASDKTVFSWSNEHTLTGDGYWGETSPVSGIAVCGATDPSADFRWHAFSCGGPEVASFICELPVPPWASGSDGCMLTSLPSLTVIYLPEQTAVELTSDCGLDGTKRIACKGKADHEEMMRQLSCGITREDFDEKISKAPNPTTDTTNARITPKTAATKPWIWTSNTIDTGDYGSPTRHRRETEDSFSTAGSISTTSQLKEETSTKDTFTTVSTMPETTRQRPSDKTIDNLTTVKPSMQSSTSVDDLNNNNQDFASINQGQLFSIIENGTLFDIIEVNDTNELDTEKSTIKHDKLTEKPLYTTVNYYKEPTVKTEENKTITQLEKQLKTGKTINDLSVNDKTFMKAIETENLDASLVKLNRTFRKELPMIEFNTTESTKVEETKNLTDFPENKIPHDHKIVEITITDFERKTDATKLYVTTKKVDKSRLVKKVQSEKKKEKVFEAPEVSFDNTTDSNTTEDIQISSKLGFFNNTEVKEVTTEESTEKSSVEETDEEVTKTIKSTEEPIEPIPEAQPRPNRNRVLTRPQRRSFYPYFFSRVLG